ncbi:MAG: leucine-rich repeat protein [Bacteroidetes bacterium]|nr:leucine-rich repeat protein [Bacteroidota bacterium]
MLNTTKYQGNGALIEHSDYASSSNTICSKNTTSDVVETAIRGGILTTSRVVVLIHILIMCAFATANLSAQSCPVASGIPTITNYQFQSPLCPMATSILCNDVINIGSGAFENCSSLESVSFPNAEYIGSSAFWNCSSLESVSFPNAEYIGSGAFMNCSSLENADFPLAKSIGNAAFDGCFSLESAYFPLVVTIDDGAFADCSNLENVDFPKAGSIGIIAFEGCTNLNSIKLGAVPPTLGANVFRYVNLSDVTLHIPAGSRGVYEIHSSWGTTFLSQFAAVEEYCDPATPSLSVIISGSGSVVTSPLATANLPCSTVVSLTATADDCYQFDGWTNADGSPLSPNATETIAVVKDSTITANFTLIVATYTLSVSSNNPAMGTASSSVSSETCGSSVSVTATPNAGYKFVGWDDGGGIVSNANPHIFNIAANTSLTAVFDDAKKKSRIKKINVKKGRLIITPQP